MFLLKNMKEEGKINATKYEEGLNVGGKMLGNICI